MAEAKPNVSKHILDKAAFVFLRHPDQLYSRRDIQDLLGISKSTASRLLTELSLAMSLEETREGQTIYYSLSASQCVQITKALDFIAAVNDRERLAMNFLLHSYRGASLFKEEMQMLEKKFDDIGYISYRSEAIQNAQKNVQKLQADDCYLVDTLFNSLETRTKIKLEYKGAFSDRVKIHELWPVGMYMRDENLYLYAYSPRFEDATSFAYSRIVSIDYQADDHYELPADISMNDVIHDPFGIAITSPVKAVVKVMNKQAFFEKEKKWPVGTKITDLEDGSIRMEFNISDPFAFRTWALSLGENCIVESPDDLAGWVFQEHYKATKYYEGRFLGEDE